MVLISDIHICEIFLMLSPVSRRKKVETTEPVPSKQKYFSHYNLPKNYIFLSALAYPQTGSSRCRQGE